MRIGRLRVGEARVREARAMFSRATEAGAKLGKAREAEDRPWRSQAAAAAGLCVPAGHPEQVVTTPGQPVTRRGGGGEGGGGGGGGGVVGWLVGWLVGYYGSGHKGQCGDCSMDLRL